MISNVFKIILLCVTCGISAISFSQEGHPIKGSWIGEWESNETHGEFVLIVLNWDGEKITGMINPGTDNININKATLNPEDWSVVLIADTTKNDKEIHYIIEANFENLELASRKLVGTWRSQNGSGKFEIARQ